MSDFISVSARAPIANALLEIGSPEYNRIRYPKARVRYSANSTPSWKTKLISQINAKNAGRMVFSSGPPTVVGGNSGKHPLHTIFLEDLIHCIANNLRFKTKTFEYNPANGHILVSGKYVGTYDSRRGCLKSFTLKHINDKFSRYRLRDFGILTVKKKDGYYLRVIATARYVALIKRIHGELSNLPFVFRPEFDGVKIQEDGVFTNFYFKLREDVEYTIDALPGNREGLVGYGADLETGIAKVNCSIFHNGQFSDNREALLSDIQGEYLKFKDLMAEVRTSILEIVDFSNIRERFLNFVGPFLKHKFAIFYLYESSNVFSTYIAGQSVKVSLMEDNKAKIVIGRASNVFNLPEGLPSIFYNSHYYRYKIETPRDADVFHCLSENICSRLYLPTESPGEVEIFSNLHPSRERVRPILHSLLGKEVLLPY